MYTSSNKLKHTEKNILTKEKEGWGAGVELDKNSERVMARSTERQKMGNKNKELLRYMNWD